MEVVTTKRLRRTWTCIKLALFLGFFAMSLIALAAIGLYAYAKIQGPPPLHVPQTTVFYASDGSRIGETRHGGENRYWVSLDEIAEPLIHATIAIEDKRFYNHFGFDFRRIAGAAIEDLMTMSMSEGASTITMQYARNLYLTQEKTWIRKIKEALYTLRLEANYSKGTILEGYLNTIYYGHSSYGIEAAAQYYFGKDAKDLTLAEASMLAGIPNGPRYYSPYYNMDNAQHRQKTVLEAMVTAGYITEKEAEAAAKQPLNFIEHHKETEPHSLAPYFQKTVERILKEKLHIQPEMIESGGLRVYTTLDPELQKIAEKWVDQAIDDDSKIQVAMVAMNPQNGNVKALIGGRNFEKSPYNRAVQAKRQPGSSFKPFLYYAALKNGFTPSTQLLSEPTTFRYNHGESTYSPHNYGGYYANDFITLMQALALSDNVYAVKTNMLIGPEKLVKTAKKAGITSPLAAIPSLALGTKPVSPLEMVRGYSAFANGGYRIEPRFITKIIDPEGNVIYKSEPQKEQVFDPQTAFVLAHMMTGTFDESLNDYTTVTGRNINNYLNRQVAGKSGTTATDSWMIGFTPKLAAGVWTGYDKGKTLDPVTDTHYSKKIWGHFMKEALEGQPKKPFDPPKGVVGVWVDPDTGKLATEDCPQRRFAYYVKGTQPTRYCRKHLKGTDRPEGNSPKTEEKENQSWLDRLFDWF
ncbi:MAG TPA: transglycosylase domain-containing protein [Bacillales bacterium]|nr:transglycosylase domain-containing protein [Bacillales bacterium]